MGGGDREVGALVPGRLSKAGLLELCGFAGLLVATGGVWTDLLRVLLQEDGRMVKKEFHLTQRRNGNSGKMTRG